MYSVDFSLTNGLGRPSVSIYYSGCDIPNKCEECHNEELWFNQEALLSYRDVFNKVDWYRNFNYDKSLIVSFLGGDPLAPYNRESVISVSKKLKEDFPGIKLIIYSWRKPEEIEDDWVRYFDYGVLGKFDNSQYQEGYLPASNNQVIYDFKAGVTLDPIKLR